MARWVVTSPASRRKKYACSGEKSGIKDHQPQQESRPAPSVTMPRYMRHKTASSTPCKYWNRPKAVLSNTAGRMGQRAARTQRKKTGTTRVTGSSPRIIRCRRWRPLDAVRQADRRSWE